MFYLFSGLPLMCGSAIHAAGRRFNHKKKIEIFSVLLCTALLFAAGVPAYAAAVKTSVQTYTTRNKDERREFPQNQTIGETKYRLQGVSYRVVFQKDVMKDTVVKRSIVYGNLLNKNVSAPDTLNVTEGDRKIRLNLTGVVYSDTVIQGRKHHLTAYTDFGLRTSEPQAEPAKQVTYKDDVTGKTVPATLPLTSVQKTGDWVWLNDFTFPIVFSIYDAEYYRVGNQVVPYNDSAPQMKGCETELLNTMHLSPNEYKITSFTWNGKPYTQGGVTYRKAIATGSRRVARFLANYDATIALPGAPGYKASANYEGKISVPDPSGAKDYTMEAKATYAPVPNPPKESFNLTKVLVPVMIGLIVVVLLIVAILYISARKKKQRKGAKNHAGLY